MEKEQLKIELEQKMLVLSGQMKQAAGHAGKIPQIEIDIMLSGLREIYDDLCQLNKLNGSYIDKVGNELKAIIREVEPEITRDEIKHVEASVSFDVETVRAEEKKEEPVSQAVEIIEIQKEETTVSKKPSAPAVQEIKTVATSYSVKTTLHEKMSEKPSKSLASNLQSKPVEDLKKSIGINEKYVFVKELFNGDQQEFNNCIDTLNKFTSYSEARSHLFDQLARPLNWNTEDKTFAELSELVRRRFNG